MLETFFWAKRWEKALLPPPFFPSFLFPSFPKEFTPEAIRWRQTTVGSDGQWERVRSCRAQSRGAGARWDEKGATHAGSYMEGRVKAQVRVVGGGGSTDDGQTHSR